MHEFAIAQSIRDIVFENISTLLEQSKIEVELVRVRCGVLSQIVPEVLEEAFNALIQGDEPLQNAKLEIEMVLAKVECLACHAIFTRKTKDEIFLPCPECASVGSNNLLEGKEMLVDHIEVNDFT